MNCRAAITRINAKHRVAEGSTPREIMFTQQKAANLVGKLMHHAVSKGQRHKGKWI